MLNITNNNNDDQRVEAMKFDDLSAAPIKSPTINFDILSLTATTSNLANIAKNK